MGWGARGLLERIEELNEIEGPTTNAATMSLNATPRGAPLFLNYSNPQTRQQSQLPFRHRIPSAHRPPQPPRGCVPIFVGADKQEPKAGGFIEYL